MKETTTKYLKFIPLEFKKLKTQVFDVRNVDSHSLLGRVGWYSPWRRYAFIPLEKRVFDAKCIIDIATFLTSLMDERKLK